MTTQEAVAIIESAAEGKRGATEIMLLIMHPELDMTEVDAARAKKMHVYSETIYDGYGYTEDRGHICDACLDAERTRKGATLMRDGQDNTLIIMTIIEPLHMLRVMRVDNPTQYLNESETLQEQSCDCWDCKGMAQEPDRIITYRLTIDSDTHVLGYRTEYQDILADLAQTYEAALLHDDSVQSFEVHE